MRQRWTGSSPQLLRVNGDTVIRSENGDQFRQIQFSPECDYNRRRARARIRSMAGRKTKHPRRTLTPQGPPSRPGENIQVGGTKVGLKSGAMKSDSTRAKRRSGAVR